MVVLDQGGELVAMARMDGMWPDAFDLAAGKAQMARSVHAPSSAIVAMM
ncbi:heme-binding protein [Labrys neptuniae]|nr:heme-binding protein [Labrys neptuniae]MDT3382441.1 heme-binding protein [Labrys neptuniae]